jgi:hypothetical protein
MSANHAVAEDKRSPSLKTLVRKYVDLIARISAANPDLARQHQNLFYFLSYVWLADPVGDAEVEAGLTRRREEYAQLGFDGAQVKLELGQVLDEDRHLRECCSTLLNLAYFLDIEFISYAASHQSESGISEEEYDNVFKGFSDYVYAEPFRTLALSHLYNFEAEDNDLLFDVVRVVRLNASEISRILGEPTNQSFIHPHGVGDYFILTEAAGPNDDLLSWLFDERYKATEFANILQYFKDGIVHVDYTVPHFFPRWVNQIRKRGIFYIGEPHRLWYAGGQKFYRLSRTEAEQVSGWWALSLSPPVSTRLNEERNKPREAMRRAGIFYESHHEKADATSKLIDLAIALEALFSPSDKGELTYRMAQSASFLIAKDAEERKDVYRFVKTMYSRRSALFHGQYDVDAYSDGKFVTDEEIEKLASVIRRSMLKFLVLFLRGSNKPQDILDRLNLCMLDPDEARRMMEESEINTLIKEYSSKLKMNGGPVENPPKL